jgi:ketosteroid isomerase-like protein
MAALRGGDGPAAASAYTDDARLMAPSAELLAGRPSIARFWQAGIDAGVDSIELHAVDLVIESDDTAHEIGRYVLRLTSPSGEAVVDRGRYMLVYRREADGAWRRAAETFNPEDAPSREGEAMPSTAASLAEGVP